MKDDMSHIEKAKEIGKKSVTESWTSEKTMQAIASLMLEFPNDFSAEIQSALAQGIMEAARENKGKLTSED